MGDRDAGRSALRWSRRQRDRSEHGERRWEPTGRGSTMPATAVRAAAIIIMGMITLWLERYTEWPQKVSH